MKKQNLVIIGIGVILIAILAIVVIGSIDSSLGNYDDFAEFLTEEGVIMYGTNWCSYCQQQKDLFEGSFNKITFVDCAVKKQECVDVGVRGYPTWVIGGELYPGLQSLEKLAELTNYELQ